MVYTGTNESNATAYATSLDDGAGSSNLFYKVFPGGIPAGNGNGQWREDTNNTYTLNIDSQDVVFTYDPTEGTFTCTADASASGKICKRLIH